MTSPLDPRLAALERRLERASLPMAPPDLRPRVLSAVGAVLDETPSTISRGRLGETLPSSEDGLSGTLVVSAVAAAIALVAFSGIADSTLPVPLSLDDRARIAGVSDVTPALPVTGGRTTDVALQPSPAADASARPGVLRVLDTHRILQETL